MTEASKPWYLRPVAGWSVFRSVPLRRLWVLLVAGFLLFASAGYYADLLENGTMPYAIVFMIATYSGLNACAWIIGVSRLPAPLISLLVALQFFNSQIIDRIAHWMRAHFILRPVASSTGIHFAANAIFYGCVLSYVFFIRYISGEGRRALQLQNDLELAHNIQKTLVPPLRLRTACFEVFGTSRPSENVGGDLVDAVVFDGGDAVAYLADITGHGLAASILMGRLKTAIRMALVDAGEREPQRTLPLLLGRLNQVLPQVKEPHMFATFTGLRLGADGSVFYALAASPPLMHWQAGAQSVSMNQEPQLPLGLLPVSAFEGFQLQTEPGDLLIVTTDGILEVCDRQEEEFGVERLEAVIVKHSMLPLPDLAGKILEAARAFGKQLDDQTILLVRCL